MAADERIVPNAADVKTVTLKDRKITLTLATDKRLEVSADTLRTMFTSIYSTRNGNVILSDGTVASVLQFEDPYELEIFGFPETLIKHIAAGRQACEIVTLAGLANEYCAIFRRNIVFHTRDLNKFIAWKKANTGLLWSEHYPDPTT